MANGVGLQVRKLSYSPPRSAINIASLFWYHINPIDEHCSIPINPIYVCCFISLVSYKPDRRALRHSHKPARCVLLHFLDIPYTR